MTNWANVLSWLRLVLIIPISIFAYFEMTTSVLILYIIAALTDSIDGSVARYQKLASQKGADLDGTIDLIFAVFSLWWIYLLVPNFYSEYWPYLLIVLVVFILFFIVSFAKLKKAAIFHTKVSKLSMLLFSILLPVFLIWEVQAWLVHLTWVVVVISRLEMIIYMLRGGKDLSIKSMFH